MYEIIFMAMILSLPKIPHDMKIDAFAHDPVLRKETLRNLFTSRQTINFHDLDCMRAAMEVILNPDEDLTINPISDDILYLLGWVCGLIPNRDKRERAIRQVLAHMPNWRTIQHDYDVMQKMIVAMQNMKNGEDINVDDEFLTMCMKTLRDENGFIHDNTTMLLKDISLNAAKRGMVPMYNAAIIPEVITSLGVMWHGEDPMIRDAFRSTTCVSFYNVLFRELFAVMDRFEQYLGRISMYSAGCREGTTEEGKEQ